MEKAKILVVDDESRMRKLVRDFLVKSNYSVIEAADGCEALDLFYEEKDICAKRGRKKTSNIKKFPDMN